MKKLLNLIERKIFRENAPLIFLVGLCPLLAASKTVMSGLVMATAIMLVLTFSCAVISLIRKLVPDNVRTVAYMLVIACFVSVAEILIRSYLPTHFANLGIYIPIIASSGIVFARVDCVASKNGVAVSVLDGIFTGISFAVVILVMSIIRELFGSGTILGYRIMSEEYGMSFALSPAGGLILLGFLIAILKKINTMRALKKEEEK